MKSLLHKDEPLIRIGDYRPDIAVAKSTIRGVKYSSGTNMMYRVNYHDLYYPIYQYNPGSTSYNFSASYGLGAGPSSSQIEKFKVSVMHIDFRETASANNAQG